MEPKEITKYPGYYEILNFSKYGISQEGNVIDVLTGELEESFVLPSGYCQYCLIKDTTNKKSLIGRHRLLMIAFKHPGTDIRKLVVNHLNGIRGDDKLGNLEWTTSKGNVEHAGKLGLTSKCIPITVRDVDTGEITNYPSFIECAKALGLSKDAIAWRINTKDESWVFPERKQYRSGHDNRDWIVPENIQKAIEKNGNSKKVLIKYLDTGIILSFKTLTDAAQATKHSPGAVSTWLSNPEQPVLSGLIQFKWDDGSPWRRVIDPYYELDKPGGKRVIVVTNSKNGNIRIFETAILCCKVMDLKPSTLNMRLSFLKPKVWPDGYIYEYYRDKFKHLTVLYTGNCVASLPELTGSPLESSTPSTA